MSIVTLKIERKGEDIFVTGLEGKREVVNIRNAPSRSCKFVKECPHFLIHYREDCGKGAYVIIGHNAVACFEWGLTIYLKDGETKNIVFEPWRLLSDLLYAKNCRI